MSLPRVVLSQAAIVLLCLFTLASRTSIADEKPASPSPAVNPPPASPEGEEIEGDKIRESYWGRGDENQVGVVQDRLYAKRQKIEISLIGGVDIGDPFLSTYLYGASFGYHFSELYSLHAIVLGMANSNSRALTALQNDTGTTANTNLPQSYLGAEFRASFLYGKLGLLGQRIVHFDTYLSVGLGRMGTESGADLGITAGIGQQYHLSQNFALNLDLKLLRYDETVLEKQAGQSVAIGQPLGNRSSFNFVIDFGLSVFFDMFADGGSDKTPKSPPAS